MTVAELNELCADPKRIGARMRALRKARGLTSLQLAERIGIARGNYCRCERGIHQQSLWILARFCTALEMRLVDLLEESIP